MQINTSHSIAALTGIFVAFAPFIVTCAIAEPPDLDVVCSGNYYRRTGDPFPTTEAVSFKREDKKLITISFPGAHKPTKANIISSNSIQLKFSADSMTGEYFNFTGDLFLIHKDRRLMKLVCKPKAWAD